ncbi:SCO-spondin-like [Dreissena polymorpha]|uniref:SCO-spondin-like n=1 Tax=Dreissena polymorpha TaxID=45954 RepID=UPI0022653811|nr:SCO-spondin-like [Dreissena polymorpha]XP_052233783.1 SCO-spondin-like [Dreissena polymorpha]
MKVPTALVAIWLIYIFGQNVEALTCLKCDYVVMPRHCKTVISCPDDDSCFVERQTNAFGEIGFNLGCLAKRSCRNSTSSSSHCTKCCDRDMCNQAGCGAEGYPLQRGPVCYSCANPLPEGRCHNIDVCQEGEVCSINGEDDFGTILFTSGCMPKDHCVSHPEGVLIGRRSQINSTLTRSHGLHGCFHCCDVDLCNKNCQTRVDGQWGAWTAWSLCTSHCNQTRTRACNNPALLHGGTDCPGLSTHTQGCYTDQCQMDGQWGAWTAWSLCTSHCNQTRTRACNNPAPLHGGTDCPGLSTNTQGCYTDQCQLDGQWGAWTAWSLCTSHCNQTRTRACNNPAPLHGGTDCPGLSTHTQGCYADQCQMKDCSVLLSSGAARLSGVYNITTPLTHTNIQVYCDMETDGGGWTVFQKRFNGSEDFYRNFRDYENGFGSVHAEHWLGLKYIHEITSSASYLLRVDIVHPNGSKGYDVYGDFSVQPGTNYTLNIGSQLRSNGVLIEYSFIKSLKLGAIPAGNAFTTYDHDADRGSHGNCAELYKGGWWYNNCYQYINLNGLYLPGQVAGYQAMCYDSFIGIAASTMMFKSV